MKDPVGGNEPTVVKEIDCFINPNLTKTMILLLHKNRDKSRPLETEHIIRSRIKATLDHIEINIADGRMENVKSSAEKKDSYMLRSIPEKTKSFLVGYFVNDECHFVPFKGNCLLMNNIKEPVKMSDLVEPKEGPKKPTPSTSKAKPTVVSARMRTEAEIFGAKRAASRRKTADNDADLKYLTQLYMTPWKNARIRTHKPLYAFEHRSILMCSTEHSSIGANEFTRNDMENLLLSAIQNDANDAVRNGAEPKKKATLKDLVCGLLVKAQAIKFDKLMECLRERAVDKTQVTVSNVIAILNELAVLILGWWVVRSDILYSKISSTERGSAPINELVKARDYVMAVFHRGEHLTRKTVSSITKLSSNEVTEILAPLGTRISSGLDGHSNHWEFRQPDIAFIKKFPEVVRQHAEGWELRIKQLCQMLKMETLVSDGRYRRRRCSGRISGSDGEDLLSPLSPPTRVGASKRSRTRLLSANGSPPPSPKRIRTQSVNVNSGRATPSSLSRPLSPPMARPTPPLFSETPLPQQPMETGSPPPPPPLLSPEKTLKRPVTPLETPVATLQAPPMPPAAFRLTSTSPSDCLKREPSSPKRAEVPTESASDPAPPLPPPSPLSEPVTTTAAEKMEEPDVEPSHAKEIEQPASQKAYSMVDDPVILSFVKDKLEALPILALSEITRACQPFLATHASQMAVNGVTPPPGSEAEREMLKAELYKVVVAVGGRELKVQWPNLSTALPKQPLFVSEVAPDLGDVSSPLHKARDAILKSFETSSYATFGAIKKHLADTSIADNTLRTTIKRYCVYRHSKYFLRHTVKD